MGKYALLSLGPVWGAIWFALSEIFLLLGSLFELKFSGLQSIKNIFPEKQIDLSSDEVGEPHLGFSKKNPSFEVSDYK